MENINKSSFFFKTRLTVLQKICLAGLFTALVVILQKVLAINYIPIAPFVRISFGAVGFIIFSSILLGPIYGLAVGALSDILGWLIFDPKTMGFFPTITLIYAALGVIAYFVFSLIIKIKNEKAIKIVEYSVFGALFLSVTLFLCFSDKITLYSSTYNIELWQKIVIPVVLAALLGGMVLFNFLFRRHFAKKYPVHPFNVYQVSFTCFVLEVTVMVIFGSLMKAIAFGFQTYLAILLTQIMVAFVNIPISTIIVSYALLLTKRYYN